MTAQTRVVGARITRVDALDKVTGRAQYGADIHPSRMLHCRLLGSYLPHALIKHIDVSRASALPGVKAVVTAADFPDVLVGFSIRDRPVLARDKVRFVGETVAAVAAVDEDTARAALEMIDVEYEELPAIFTMEAALAADAPRIHDRAGSYTTNFDAQAYDNVCSHTSIQRGEVAAALQKSDLVLERRYRTPLQHQGYTEPHAMVASADQSGRVTVWTSHQGPFLVRNELAPLLELPMSRVRVIGTYVGGAFGGKADTVFEPIVARLSQKAGRPVQLVLSRADEFMLGFPKHPSDITLKTGMTRDGHLTAVEAKALFNTGAYAGFGPLTAGRVMLATGPYRVPAVKLDGYAVYTNMVSCGACRGPGAFQAAFAIEQQMDELAREVGIDPLELRLLNGLQDGDLTATGAHLHGSSYRETIEAIRERAATLPPLERQDSRRPWIRRGRGVASSLWGTGAFASAATVKLNEDGTLGVQFGSPEVGTGANTVLSQMVAEQLGVDFGDVHIEVADTDTAPYDLASGSSRITYTGGLSVVQAAQTVRQQICELAASELEVNVEDLALSGGRVHVRGAKDVGLTLAQVSRRAHQLPRGPIAATASLRPEAPEWDREGVKGHPLPSKCAETFNTHLCEVEVDTRTGKVTVSRYIAAHDVGRAINPIGVEGQIQGGVIHGIGYALMEEMVLDQGRVVNPSFFEYRVPLAPEVPLVEAIIIEKPLADGPFGAKGVGETGGFPPGAAIANAVFDATGVRIRQAPLHPERVLSALAAARTEGPDANN